MTVAGEEQSLPMRTDVGQVKKRRQRLGLKIGELADEAGISRDTLSDLEAGNRRPYPDTLDKVLAALDRLEHEMGVDAPPLPSGVRQIGDPADELFEVAVEDGSLRVVVKGVVRDEAERDAITAQALRAIRQARADAEEARQKRAAP